MMDNILSAIGRIFFWIVITAVSFVMLTFAMQNGHEVSLYFDFLKSSDNAHLPIITLPVWGFTLVIFILGILIGLLIMWYLDAALRDAVEEEKTSNTKLKKDMDNLKQTISKTVA